MARFLLALLVLFCFYLKAQPELFALDEMDIAFFQGTSQSGSRVAVLYVKELLHSKIGIFNFENEKMVHVEDGRIQGFGAHYTVTSAEGFLVVNSILSPPVCNYLTWSGEFVWKRSLSEFEGWQTGYRIKHGFMPRSKGPALATIAANKERVVLADIDFDGGLITQLASRPIEKNLEHFGATDGSDYYWVNADTGEIELLDRKTFKRQKVLRPAQEPVKKEKARPRRSVYFQILGEPRLVDGTLYLKWNQYRDKFGNLLDKPRFKALAIKGERLWQVDHYPVAYWKGKYLVYDRVERTLALREHLTDP